MLSTTHRVKNVLLALPFLLWGLPLMGQVTTTYSAERDDHNNTSAADRFPGNTDNCEGRSPGNPPAGNVSKLPTRSLLYIEATTKLYAHFLPWFCTNAKLDPDYIVRCNGHVLTGYDSNDARQVKRQIEDMISRGIDGMIVDWYGPAATIEEGTTRHVKAEAEKHAGFEFAIMEDVGAFRSAPDKVAKLIADLNYVADNYYGSPAYMRRSGRPVLFFFVDFSVLRDEEWDAVRLGIRGNPLFIFQDIIRRQSDGGFAWIGLSPHPFCEYLDDFYAFVKSSAAGKMVFGSAYQGFDDTLAGWPLDSNGNKIVRKLDRRCGRTWLCSFKSANNAFDAGHQLPSLQIVTWNDYDEGTEIESGIDNCLALSASIDGGGHLHWVLKWNSPEGTESTIDRYRIFSSADGENLILRKEVAAGEGPQSVDLATLGLPAGAQTIFVQAVGKPSIRNHIVNAGTWSGAKVPAAALASSGHRSDGFAGVIANATDPVTISSPTSGATVTSPIHVIADENSLAAATDMQIYLDGSVVVDHPNVEHLDELVPALPGPHQIAVKAWYGDGSSNLATVDVTVADLSGAHIIISSPAPCATVSSPIHVIADENSAITATAMQVYLDGVLAADRPGVEHIDELLPAPPGPHQIAVKAWYGSTTPGDPATVDIVVVPTIVITSPAAGATISSPMHVVADENTAAAASAMQIYVDGVLVIERLIVDHVDELVPASPGSHQIAVKAWYPHCPGEPVTVDVIVEPDGPPIIVSSPAAGAAVSSPIHVVADENTAATATAMQIYVDGVLIVDCPNAQHLDELLAASTGFHQIAAKAWYADGTNKVATVNVLVSSELPGGPITVFSPASCATVSSPVHVIASENTAERATVMQIYVDGVLAVERPNVEHVDELIPASAGSHWIVVKAWYAGGCNRLVSVYITVSSTRRRSLHATGAGDVPHSQLIGREAGRALVVRKCSAEAFDYVRPLSRIR